MGIRFEGKCSLYGDVHFIECTLYGEFTVLSNKKYAFRLMKNIGITHTPQEIYRILRYIIFPPEVHKQPLLIICFPRFDHLVSCLSRSNHPYIIHKGQAKASKLQVCCFVAYPKHTQQSYDDAHRICHGCYLQGSTDIDSHNHYILPQLA